MAATKIGIIYSKETNQVLRVVIPDNDAQLALHVSEGEAVLEYDKTEYPDLEGPDALAVVAQLVADANVVLGNEIIESKISPAKIEDLDPKSIGRSNPDR